jgi:hypothetical protein
VQGCELHTVDAFTVCNSHPCTLSCRQCPDTRTYTCQKSSGAVPRALHPTGYEEISWMTQEWINTETLRYLAHKKLHPHRTLQQDYA